MITKPKTPKALDAVPRAMSEYRVSWEQAARRLGEDLSSDGPNGYGSFTPAQWLQWARGAVAGWKQRDAQWQHKWSRAVGTGTSNTLREADRADAAEARLKALEPEPEPEGGEG